jgi:Mg2+-importing ATPase
VPVDPVWWSRPADELAASLGSRPAGLTPAEAGVRLRETGPNLIEAEAGHDAAALLLRQFASPLVLILVVAALLSLAMRDWVEASIILAIVGGSALLGFAQEYRASTAVAQLRQRIAIRVRARRGGALLDIPLRDVVPGDIVLLSAGNLVPADGVVIEARDFLVSEASLTGESFPVEKAPGTAPPEATLAQRTNAVFLGTSVRSGSATVLVARTGRDTAYGAVADRLRLAPPETEFAHGVRQFGLLLVRVMVVMVIFVMAMNHLLGRPAIDSLLFALALAVGLSPELLPAIMSVTLARGARAMAREGVIVRRLEAIEDLGGMDILCTDKTGTLTTGTATLVATPGTDGSPSARVRRLAVLNAAHETGIENPLDAAILAAEPGHASLAAGYPKIDEIPYDFLRKRLTIVVGEPEGGCLLITKGAFASVLGACGTIRRGDEAFSLDDESRGALEAVQRAMGEAGDRVLALASRTVERRERYGHEDEQGLVFEGFLRFRDPAKPGASRTLAALAARGIRTKVITGDNRHVAAHFAAEVGLDPSTMLTGPEIASMRDEALWARAPRTDVFAEVDPQQKERIVRALQRGGHAVGYLGDGINDAPALHAADVGISVDGAVDVARQSADVILLRSDLDILRRGVEEGRRAFANTLKYIRITTSANFGNMASMALATPLLPFLPLAAKQILLNNFLSDLPSMAISTDRVDAGEVAAPQHWDVGETRRFMVVFGLLSSVFDLATFALLLGPFGAQEAVFQTAWFVLSLVTELAVVLVLRTRASALASRAAPVVLVATLAVAVLAFALPWIGPLARLFGFVPLPPSLLVTMVALVATYLVANEVAKRIFFRRKAAT